MKQHTFNFIANQAAPGIVFTPAVAPEPMTPGNFAGWSSASFAPNESNLVEALEPDGGHWVGTVHMLGDGVVNMSATYFPVKGEPDNVQLAGPLMTAAPESAVAIVGGGGRFAGARGEARVRIAFSDVGAPLYRYEMQLTV
jgi:hypothetical protein